MSKIEDGSESKHTPGPWEIDGTGSILRTKTGINERGGMTGGALVAQFFGNGRPTAANARLIAAAPDMFEVACMVDAWGNGLRHLTAHEAKMVKAARAALSKATGGKATTSPSAVEGGQ